MAYPEKSSQRSSVSSVSSHVRLSQSSSKSYSLLGARGQHVSTVQKNSCHQDRQSTAKDLVLVCTGTNSQWGKGWLYSQKPQTELVTQKIQEQKRSMAEGKWLSTAFSGTCHLGRHYHESEGTVELKQAPWKIHHPCCPWEAIGLEAGWEYPRTGGQGYRQHSSTKAASSPWP